MNTGQRKFKALLMVVFFLFILFIMTFPLLLHLNKYIPGFYSSDEPFVVLQGFWWLKFSFVNHYQWTNEFVKAYPFGIHHDPVGIHPLWFHISRCISIASNWVLAYNLPLILNFIVSFLCMFYLFYYLTREPFISFFVGITYSLCPYQFSRFWQHFALAFTAFLPLYILSLIKLHQYRRLKDILFCTLIFSLLVSLELHYAFFMLITTFLFMFYSIFIKAEPRKIPLARVYLTAIFFIAVTSIIILNQFLLRIIFPSTKLITPSAYTSIRPFADLFAQSAKPLSYLLPATTHPVFGKFTVNFIGSSLYGESLTEHVLFLGWIPLILAFIGIKRKNLFKTAFQGKDFYITFFILLVLVAWIFSQPPWWQFGALKIYFPSFVIYKIIPAFRAYCRFGIVVMLGVAILAGFGLGSILKKLKSARAKFTVTMLFCILVLFEFWNWPPYKVIDVSKVPEVYYWLKKQPKDIVVAEYPIDTNGANEMYELYQIVHEKSMINGTIPETYPNRIARSITKLSAQETAAALAWLGVKYVLVHREDYFNTGLVEDMKELDRIPYNRSLSLIRSFPSQECPREDIACVQKTGPIDVYEIVALPIEPKVEK